MSREYLVTIWCDHDCGPYYGLEAFPQTHICIQQNKWEPDKVNDTAKGWHVDYEINQHIDDAEPEDYCGPCWAQLQSEMDVPHTEGE